jgi:tetratricopeptide (TPR) repeat protein
MNTVEVWKSRPIFVTSTFQDMQAERDHLFLHVFPALEEWLATRRRHLEWIDLRVGIPVSKAEEASREQTILRVCLEEARRSRPFIIGLLGDRYGWVPPPDRIAEAANEAGFKTDFEGRSVTELEILFGVFVDLNQSRRSLFFLRAPLPYDEMLPETAQMYCEAKCVDPGARVREAKLAGLKARLLRETPELCFEYRLAWNRQSHRVEGLDQWGRMVEAKLRAALDAEFAEDPSPAELQWYEAENQVLADFLEDRSRGFVGRNHVLDQIEKSLASPPGTQPSWISVTGEPGSGKTAVFGELHRRLHASGVFTLAYSAGMHDGHAWAVPMVRRFMVELVTQPDSMHLFRYTEKGDIIEGELIHSALDQGASEEKVYEAFILLLHRTAERRRVVILMDAMNQMEPVSTARLLGRLYADLPSNVRVVSTTVPSHTGPILPEGPAIECLPLPPIDEREAREIARGVSKRYHRELDESVMDALIAARGPSRPAWSVPLWLVIAAEELNLLDADDFALARRTYSGREDQRVTAFMCDRILSMPLDIPGLYRSGIVRASDIFGQNLAAAFLGAIAVSRSGWRELDFRVLLPGLTGNAWDELQFASFRRMFRGNLRKQEPIGLWSFHHTQMRAAVRTWLSDIGTDSRVIHATIADHLLALPANDPLRRSEVMLHLIESEDWKKAANYLGGADLDKSNEAGASNVLADMIRWPVERTQEDGAHSIGRLLDEGDDALKSRVADRLLKMYYGIQGRCSLASEEVLVLAIKDCLSDLVTRDLNNGRLLERYALSVVWLGHLRRDQGDLEAALASQNLAAELRKRAATIGGSEPSGEASGNSLNVGDALLAKGDFDRALACFRNPENAESPAAYSRIGFILRTRGDLSGAMDAYRAGMELLARDARANPRDSVIQLNMGMAHSSIGGLWLEMNDYAHALGSYGEAAQFIAGVAARHPTEPHPQHEWANIHLKMAQALLGSGDVKGAQKSVETGMPILERIVMQYRDKPEYLRDLAIFNMQLGDILQLQADAAGANKHWRAAEGTLQRLVAKDASNSTWRHDLEAVSSRIRADNGAVKRGFGRFFRR